MDQSTFGFGQQMRQDTSGLWAPADAALLRSLAEASWRVVDVETTALTPFSEPVSEGQVQAALRSCGLPAGRREAAAVDRTPRLRVVTAKWGAPGEPGTMLLGAWDMDALSEEARVLVARACLAVSGSAETVLVGHNIGFDLFWLRRAVRLAGTPFPKGLHVLDSMLLARYAAPGVPLALARMAASRTDGQSTRAARELVSHRKAWSLDVLMLTLFQEVLAKGLQGPEHWTLPAPLGETHHHYATGDVVATWRLTLKLLGAEDADLAEAFAAWRRAHPDWDRMLAGQVEHLVLLRETGLPVSLEASEAYAAEEERAARRRAEEAAALAPEIGPHVDTLANPENSGDALFKAALSAAVERLDGRPLPDTDKGLICTRTDQLRARGYYDGGAGPLLQAVEEAKEHKKRAVMARQYAAFARRSPDGRLHPLLSHGTSTGRTSSQEPNIQNLPADPAFRALVQAPPGWRVVATDYAQIELRVAAALAVRAQREIATSSHPLAVQLRTGRPPEADAYAHARRSLDAAVAATRDAFGKEAKARAWDARRAAERRCMEVEAALRWHAVRSRAQAAGATEWSAMRDVFAAGGDPHLRTALGLLGRDPDAALDSAMAQSLRQDPAVAAARRGAKPANFSLLYGAQSETFRIRAKVEHGVDMTPEEAAQVREQWFNLYPEVRLWQLWTLLRPEEEVWLAEPKDGGTGVRKKPVWRVAALSGRRFTVVNPTDALNYQDQGSGADIAMLALRRLWEDRPDVARCVANFVHDEFVLVVPEERADEAVVALEEAMMWAGEEVLGTWGVPCDVETARITEHVLQDLPSWARVRAVGALPDVWVH